MHGMDINFLNKMTVNIILVSEKHVICSGEFFIIYFYISKEIVWKILVTECEDAPHFII